MRTRFDAKAAGRVISQPAVSPDGQFFLSRHADNAVRLWEMNGGRLVASFSASHAPAEPSLTFDCAWRPDSAEFAVAKADGGLAFYSPNEGKETRRWDNATRPTTPETV